MTNSDNPNISAQTPVNLARHFAVSEKFRDLFSNGMGLVEETANFLDSEGREAAKSLSKPASAIYGAESMRLTTRLMQLASWLLLQRAVAEGEMTVEQAITEKKNVTLNRLQSRHGGPGWSELPGAFIALIDRSITLQNRIMRLDAEIYGAKEEEQKPAANPVASQQELLQSAFQRFGS